MSTPRPGNEWSSRIFLRPIGSPLPLGFIALGAASVALTGIQLKWLPVSETHQVALALLALVGPLQFLAAVFGYFARDSVGGTGMGTLAGAWFFTGAVLVTGPAGSTSRSLGLVLFFVAAALLVPAVAASSGKALATVVLVAAAVRFALTAVYEFNAGATWEQISGWWGLGVCVIALYAALAFEMEDTRRATILPTGRRGDGYRALHGNLADEVDQVQHEAGVREQL